MTKIGCDKNQINLNDHSVRIMKITSVLIICIVFVGVQR